MTCVWVYTIYMFVFLKIMRISINVYGRIAEILKRHKLYEIIALGIMKII